MSEEKHHHRHHHKDKRKWPKVVKLLVITIVLLFTLYLIYSINKLNIVPTKYMILGITILLLLNIIAGALLFTKKKWPKVISTILYIIIISLSVIGIHFTNATNNFLDKAFNTAIKTHSLKFYVMSPNEHSENELTDQDIYYYDNSQYVKDAITKLNEEHKNNMILTEDITTIYNNEFFLIDEGILNMFEEERKIDITKYHIIYTIDLEYEVEQEEKKVEKGKHYYNIFVGAYDFSKIRMDMNKIVTVNTDTNEILITNIHRFSYLNVPGYKQRNTLSSMSYYGINNNIQALEQLFDIDIDYYVVAKPDGLVTLVDDIGGIEYCSDKAYITDHAKVMWTYNDRGGEHVHVKKGCQKLDGIETLTVARERMAFYWGATERDKNTTAIMIDILEAMKKPANITNYSTILNDLSGMYNTSIPRDVITSSAKKLLNDGWTIKTAAVSGTNGTNKIGFSNETGAVIYLSDSSVNEVKARIKALDK